MRENIDRVPGFDMKYDILKRNPPALSQKVVLFRIPSKATKRYIGEENE
jgi:hypothetical protein